MPMLYVKTEKEGVEFAINLDHLTHLLYTPVSQELTFHLDSGRFVSVAGTDPVAWEAVRERMELLLGSSILP